MVREMLAKRGFIKNVAKDGDREIEVWSVKFQNKPAGLDYVFSICFFKENFSFIVQDKHGVIRLLAFKLETPVDTLEKYIEKAADFFMC